MNNRVTPVELANPENQFRVDYVLRGMNAPDFDFLPSSTSTPRLPGRRGSGAAPASDAPRSEYQLIGCAQYFQDKADGIRQADISRMSPAIRTCFPAVS